MSITRKLFYSIVTVCVVFALIEGTARMVWRRLESQVFAERKARGEAMLRNDAVNYLRIGHGVYGYTLRPNSQAESVYINEQGFHQRDTIPAERRAGLLRVACLGE